MEDQLQALNIALEALGLTLPTSARDQIASLINAFSPTAYNSLVYQLEAQAANAAPSAPPAAPPKRWRRHTSQCTAAARRRSESRHGVVAFPFFPERLAAYFAGAVWRCGVKNRS